MRNIIFTLLLLLPTVAKAQYLRSGFTTPPQEARPRVWWHWMNGNITLDGIRKDIEWMQRAGIGGFHCFDAGMGMKPVVEKRLDYMSAPWKEAFRLAVGMADSLGMEVAVASCPGWSNTGGPWVKPEQAMKRLVWTDTIVKGGQQLDIDLAKPSVNRWYADINVLAMPLPTAEQALQEAKGRLTINRLDDQKDGPCAIQYSFRRPQTIKALSISDGHYRSIWAALPAPVDKWLEASYNGRHFWRVCEIPHGSVRWQTINIPPTTARHFRVVVPHASQVPELKLYATARIDHAEEKAGFASPPDLNDHPTRATAADAVNLTDIVDLSDHVDADGHLSWDAPEGQWRILRFGYTLTGKENHPASPEATGLEVTKIDREAFADFLNYYLDLYRDATGGLMGRRGLHYLLIDSYEAGWETWSPRLAQEFQQRRGYSLLPWMPVLTGLIVESAERSEEFLFDWRTTIGELIGECMYETASRIAHERGMETYFEAHENGRLYLVDGMSAKSHADIPMAAMWTVIPGEQALSSSESMAECDIRESASVAHLYGKPLVAAESMTVNGHVSGAYCFYPGNLKHTADLEMASGVNRFVIHESAHQPVDDKRPGLGLGQYGQWFNRHETWAEQARAWTDYLARSCYMLQQGRNVADLLYYYGEDDVVTDLFAHQHPEVPFGYNFDYLNKDALLQLIDFDGQCFTTPSGSRYRVLVLDGHCQHMAPAVTKKLDTLRQQGAPIFDLRTQTLAEALKGLQPDISCDDPTQLRFVHRECTPTASANGTFNDDNAAIYWICNGLHEARSLDVTFRISGRRPTLWHPETGSVEPVSYAIRDGLTTVSLHLSPDDAVFVVFQEPTSEQQVVLPEMKKTVVQRINTPWTVEFLSDQGDNTGPGKPVVFQQLRSYTESQEPAIRYYSGTAVYRNTFQMPHLGTSPTPSKRRGSTMADEGSEVFLDLGNVGCMAEVFVNGQSMGIVWKEPYQVDISRALREGTNELEVHVVNPWANRIIGDQQPDCKQQFTYTPDVFYRADSPLIPSGLLGPVSIVTFEEQ